MSRRKTDEEYSRTKTYKFFRWLSGVKDPYIDSLELQPQEEKKESEEVILEHLHDEELALEKVYDVSHNRFVNVFERVYKLVAALFCVLMLVGLLMCVSFLPENGSADTVRSNVVVDRYIENGLEETGAVNIVSGMILTYRAFDTFGETNVLFIATCCVMIMLMMDEKLLEKAEKQNDRRFEPKDDVILRLVASFLCPIIFIFAIYIMLNGHLSPGGGFSGGAVLGAGMILYVNAFGFKKTQRFFNEQIYKVAKITALCMYGLIGSYFYITGANGIANHIPLGIPGHILSSGIILPINVAVGLEVACTMYAFYALFRRGGL
ncbi:MAG: hypothetical protein KBS96_04830 [Lachnospiraceae bacterium]|nr:hypothetical protein [Candidatus Colinaster scatohippi]